MPDEELGWKFKPNKRGIIIYPGEAYHYINTNELGFRDTELENKDRVKKILVLGDSFVTNVSVKDDEVFTEVMQSNMPDHDVMNFGVNAYGQVQEYKLAQEWLPKIKPDLLVLMIYIRNDFTDNTGENDWLYTRPYASLSENDSLLQLRSAPDRPSKLVKPKQHFLNKSHLYTFVKKSLTAIKRKNAQAANSLSLINI